MCIVKEEQPQQVTKVQDNLQQNHGSKIVMQEEQVPDRAGKFKPISRGAVAAGKKVLLGLEFYQTYLPFL